MELFILVLLLLGLSFVVWLWYYEARRCKRKQFNDRSPLSDDEFILAYRKLRCDDFPAERIIALRNEIAHVAELDASLLRPDDPLSLLGPAKGWEFDGDDFCDYLAALDSEADAKSLDLNISSLADLIHIKLEITNL